MPTEPATTTSTVKHDWRTERTMQTVPAPIWAPLEKGKVWDKNDLPILDNWKSHFLQEGLLSTKDILLLLQRAAAIFKNEPNLLTVNDPITVCGDIHGQFYDLIKLFDVGGSGKTTRYLFLGDYVDRGCFSCEVIFYLLAHKLRYPKTFWMLRGNHECRHLTAYFNFKQECKHKYNQTIYDAIMNCFDCLPLATVLNNRFLCVHGGLSPDIQTLEDIMSLNRFREPPPSGPMTDLLWADPMDEEEEEQSPEATFLCNELRGCSYVFSSTATRQFLQRNNLLSVIRAHEAQDDGYRLYKKNPSTGFPTVICIFSAPDYCGQYGNKAAIIRFQNNLMNIRQFNSSPSPYYLPNFMNAFTWSIPFVCEKSTDLLLRMWDSVDDVAEKEDGAGTGLTQERIDVFREKIRAVGKLQHMMKLLREETSSVVQLGALSGGNVPVGLIQQGDEALKTAVATFEGAKSIDKLNEKRPHM